MGADGGVVRLGSGDEPGVEQPIRETGQITRHRAGFEDKDGARRVLAETGRKGGAACSGAHDDDVRPAHRRAPSRGDSAGEPLFIASDPFLLALDVTSIRHVPIA
ncbi:hypothetical protein GCM10022221_44280 [Actinocorallia aurea]